MSFKKSSMPSINESDNDEENDSNSGNCEDISTSDYSSLRREKNATLTKAIAEFMCTEADSSDVQEKVATLKNSDIDPQTLVNGDIQEGSDNDSEVSFMNFHDEKQVKDIVDTAFNDDNLPDRFGFYKGVHYTDPDSELNVPIDVVRSREKKWAEMLEKWDEYKTKKRKKIISRCRKGIPQSMRCKVWQLLCNSKSVENTVSERVLYKQQYRKSISRSLYGSNRRFRGSSMAINNPTNNSDTDSISISSFMSSFTSSNRRNGPLSPSVPFHFGTGDNIDAQPDHNPQIDAPTSHYHQLYLKYQRMNPSIEIKEQITKDIHRQFPDHETFTDRGGMGQESLATLLMCYSVKHKEIGYCQGMAPLAAALLMIMPEENAFWTFEKICEAYIPGYFDEGLLQIQIDAKAFMDLLKKESSSVYNILKSNQVDPIYFMVDWFMCIFIRTLPWPSVLLVMDMFLAEGKSILFKVGLVLVIGAIQNQRQNSNSKKSNKSSKNNSDCMMGIEMDEDIVGALRNLPSEITTPKYITSHIEKLSVSKTDIRKECKKQLNTYEKSRVKPSSKNPPR